MHSADYSNKDRILLILAWTGALLVNLKSIFVDFDIDQSYALAMAYRNIHGDNMLSRMWEPHQTSAFLIEILMYIFHAITGDYFGVAIYLQIMGVLLYAIITYILYKTINKYLDKNVAGILAAIFFAVRVKGSVLPEFSNMQICFSILLFCCLVYFLEDQNRISKLIVSGIMLALEVLSYPSCAIIYIPVIILVIIYCDNKVKNCITFSVTVFLSGLIYVGYFILRLGMNNVVEAIGNIIGYDSSHTKITLLCFDYWKGVVCGLCWIAVACLIAVVFYTFKKSKTGALSAGVIFLIFSDVIILLGANLPNTIFSWWTYVCGIIYPVLFLLGIVNLKYCNANEKRVFVVGGALSIGTCVSVFALTNLSMITVLNYMILAGVVSAIPLLKKLSHNESECDNKVMIAVFLLCLLMCVHRGIVVRDYSGNSNVITGISNVVRQGPAAGIFCGYMGYYESMCDIEDWQHYVNENDSLLLVGGKTVNSLIYMYEDVEISTPSTICTPTYNDTLLEYWETYPEKYPTVVAVECWYGTPRVEEDSWIMTWINSKDAEIIDGRYWRFYRLSAAE